MGRTRKDRHDLDDEFLDLDDDDLDADDEALAGMLLDDSVSLNKNDKNKPKINKKANDKEDDDWQDPEDDIMFGFDED